MANADYRRDAEEVLRQCRVRDVGVMIIKSCARGQWGGPRKTYSIADGQQKRFNTWYQPFDDAVHIEESVNFVLSHDVTGICTPAEPSILRLVFEACERLVPLDAEGRAAIMATAGQYTAVYDENGPVME